MTVGKPLMSDKATDERISQSAGDSTDASNPLDAWLKRELQSLYSSSGRNELPPEIAELAARLEEKLGAAEAPEDRGNDQDER